MKNQLEPIIHIGYPRSGSTYLQDIIFPQVPNYEYLRDPQIHTLMSTRYYENLPNDFILKKLGCSNYIYSCEGILAYCEHWGDHVLNNYEREIAISNLTRIYRDYGRILVVIRRQDSIIESRFKHKVFKFSGRADRIFIDFPFDRVSSYYHLTSKYGLYFTELFDYYKWIMRIANQLGKGRISILIYEDLVHEPHKYFADLADVFQQPTLEKLVLEKDTIVNASHSSSVLLPRIPPRYRFLKMPLQPIFAWVKKISRREIFLDSEIKNELLDRFTHGNRLLSIEFGLELDKYGYF